MRALVLAALLALTPVTVLAQAAPETTVQTSTEDRDFLTAFLEDNLSGAGRDVRITGFAGALSSRATFDELTIADGDGIWLRISNGAIGWSRSALLSRRVEISELSADRIEVARVPDSGSNGAVASGFSLPDLPVSVEIQNVRAGTVVLGAPVLGEDLALTLSASASLSGGQGSARIEASRTDGPRAKLSFTGSYDNATRAGTLDLATEEGENGIVSRRLNIPGAPALSLAAHGGGTWDEFKTDVALSSDGQPRLTGTIVTRAAEGGRSFGADLSGDIAPLFLPEYRAFFGDGMHIVAEGRRSDTGQMDLSQLSVTARTLNLTGSMTLSPDGLPLRAELAGQIADPTGAEVLLPMAGDKTYVGSADIAFGYDGAADEGWRLRANAIAPRRGEGRADRIAVDGSGRIGHADTGAPARIGGTLRLSAFGLVPSDPALATLVGPGPSARAVFHWQSGQPLSVPVLDLSTDGLTGSGAFTLKVPETGPEISGEATLRADDASRFSGLVGRPLGGAVSVQVRGTTGVLSGLADLDLRAEGVNLTVGLSEIDRLLRGRSSVAASILRDETGTELRSLTVRAGALSADASGRLGPTTGQFDATLSLPDLSALGPAYGGHASATVSLALTGPAQRITVEAAATDLTLPVPQAGPLLSGDTRIHVVASRDADGRIHLEDLDAANPQVTASARATVEDPGLLDVSLRLANIALLAPDFQGPLEATGTLRDAADGYALDLDTKAAAVSARIAGAVSPRADRFDLTATGRAETAIAAPFIAPRDVRGPVEFDLRLAGPAELSSLSGRIGGTGLHFSDPVSRIILDNIDASASLSGGRAEIRAAGQIGDGGRVEMSGPVTLTAPYDASLSIALNNARLRDPNLYETRLTGQLSVNGALLGGAQVAGNITLGETEIRIPDTFGTGGLDLGKVVHRNDRPAVRATRGRAGLTGQTSGGGLRRSYGLDILIDAPNRIFVRGRGLDAELGGRLRILGTTDDTRPEGVLSLIRGRLDILGKRLTIDEGEISFQGALTAFVRFTASAVSDGVTAGVEITGPVTEPEIHFVSSPSLPEEEVIARLLFGKGLDTISAFQAAQLASAIATLSGRGGEGLVSKLRKSFGLDDLDVTTDETGAATLKVGKYISEKVYTDVAVDSEGRTEINLNLDLTRRLTVKGSVATDGDTGIGVFYEKDY